MNEQIARVDRWPTEQAKLRDLLVAERASAADQVEVLQRDLTGIIEAVAGVGTDDEHDPEGSTIAFERAQVDALLTRVRDHLADLDLALERLEAGTYGTCERCGQPIAAERLVARPAARTCISCAAALAR